MSPQMAARIFSVFDKDHNGHIDFNEFVVGLSVCCRGTFGERIKFLFRLFDVNGDGTISREEVKQILTATSGMRKELGEDPSDGGDLVAELFAKYDLNHDGSFDLAEFKKIVENHPNILNVLGHDDEALCYLVALEVVVPTPGQVGSKDPDVQIRAAKRAINMVARLSKPRDRLVFFLSYLPVNMDHKPPFQPNKVYRDSYNLKRDTYKQEIVNHITTIQHEILDPTVETNVWTKKGVMAQLMKGVCDECHADFVLLSQFNTEDPEELAGVIKDSSCSLILVK